MHVAYKPPHHFTSFVAFYHYSNTAVYNNIIPLEIYEAVDLMLVGSPNIVKY